MATIRLDYEDNEPRRLPPVCICCGQLAHVHRSKIFTWSPWWIYLLIPLGALPYVIMVVFTTKQKRVHTPLCDTHKNYWRIRALMVFGGLTLVIALFVAAIQLRSVGRGSVLHLLSLGLWTATGLAFLGWLALVVVLKAKSIRAAGISDRTITLTKVSEEFAQAVENEADQENDDEEMS